MTFFKETLFYNRIFSFLKHASFEMKLFFYKETLLFKRTCFLMT